MADDRRYGEVGGEGSPDGAVYMINSRASMVELIACAAHMANRTYCQTLGDESQPLWKDAPEWQRDSACNGVKAVLANPSQTPEQSHEGWLAQKQMEGWRWGPAKDPETKEHPCMVPYGQLPENQCYKDTVFLTTVRSMAQALGILDK